MRQTNVAAAAIVIIGILAKLVGPASAQSVTAFEGARLIVGDGRVIENATVVVDGSKIAQAGTAADVRVPAGATRVNLAGKTVMPMLIDTHVHLSRARDALLRDLRLRAYYGVSAALSLGTDSYDVLTCAARRCRGRRGSSARGAASPCPSPDAPPRRTRSPPRRRAARPSRSWRPTRSTSSRSGSTPGTASTRR